MPVLVSRANNRRFILLTSNMKPGWRTRRAASSATIIDDVYAAALDMFVEAGIDVLIGIDPSPAALNDLPLMKEKLRRQDLHLGRNRRSSHDRVEPLRKSAAKPRKLFICWGRTGLYCRR